MDPITTAIISSNAMIVSKLINDFGIKDRIANYFSKEELITNFFSKEELITLNLSEETTEELNQEYFNSLKTKVEPLLLSLLRNEDFEFDIIPESVKLIETHLRENPFATKQWFNEIYVEYFHDEKVLIALLGIIVFLTEQDLYPINKTMALAALTHRNDEVKELGVRAFESWASHDSLRILKEVKLDTKWLQEYIDQVIKDLEFELCL